MTTLNTQELLQSVTKTITHIPKRELKNYFARHCAANRLDMRRVQSDWKVFSAAFDSFKTSFETKLDDTDFFQRVVIQLACASALLGKLDPHNDPQGLYGGCSIFVSEWCAWMGQAFFGDCNPLAFFAIWSPFLKRFGVGWEFHGTTSTVLIALEDCVDEAGEAFASNFPGPAPLQDDDDKAFVNWAKFLRRMGESERITAIFGGSISSRQITYYNPVDESFELHRKYDKVWAIDTLQPPPEVVEFEQEDDDDELKETFSKEMAKLGSLLGGRNGGAEKEGTQE